MDIEFLRSLASVVDAGSIAEAARRQNLTAAAIGQRIRKLERQIGIALFEKVGVAARPTPGCETLLPHIRALIADADSLIERLDETGLSGSLRMGAISTEIGATIPRVLDRLKTACPRVHLSVVPGTSQQLYEALNLGTLDLALTVRPEFPLPGSRNVVPLKRQKIVLLSPKGTHGSVEQILGTIPFIRYDARSWGGEMIESHLAGLAVPRDVLCDIDSLETIAVMVGNGMGASVVPAWDGIELFGPRLTITPMPETAGHREICLIHDLPVRLPRVIEIITAICKDAGPRGPA